MCGVYFHQVTMENKSENRRNTKNILVFQNIIQLVSRALVAVREKKKLVNMKPQH